MPIVRRAASSAAENHERTHAHVEQRQVTHDIHEAVGVQRHVQATVDRDDCQKDVADCGRAGAVPECRCRPHEDESDAATQEQ